MPSRLARHLHPSLTTIRQSIDKAGTAMVDMLLSVAEGRKAAPVQLPTELVLRESTRTLAREVAPKRRAARG